MADETVVATSEPGGSPAAAPETTSAAAPVAAAEPSSSTPAVEAPLTRGADEEPAAYLKRVSEAKNKAAQAPEVKQEPVKEEPKPEEKKEEPKPKEKKDEEPAEEDVDADPFTLEDKAPLPPRELAAKLKADPELAAKLEAAGIKDEVFANARLANKAVAFIEEFPGGVEDAKYAKGQAELFGQFDDLITSARVDPTAADKIIGKMMELDYVIGDDGKPVLDPTTGQPRLQGNAQAFVEQLSDATWDMRLDAITREAEALLKANPDDETANSLIAAVDILKSRKNGSDPEGEMTEAQKAKAVELKSREDALARDQESKRVAEYEAREARIGTAMDSAVNSEIESILGKTDLAKEQWPLILNEVRMAAAEKLSKDSLFTGRRDWIMRAQFSPEVEKQRVAHAVNSSKAVIIGPKGILAQTLKKYGVKVTSASQERRAKIDTQIEASKKDIKGSGVASAPSPLSGPELRTKAMDEIKKAGGDPFDTHELSRMMFKLRQQGA